MIRINLLPHREEARKRRKEAFGASMVAAVLVGAAIGGLIFLYFQGRINAQQERNQFLRTEIQKLERQIAEIANIESEIARLRARQRAVEDLQSDRNLPVHLLNEVVKQLPDGLYISSLRQQGQEISIQGVAQSNERVSELLRNLADNTPWLSRPSLVEIVAGTLNLSQRDQRRVSNFNVGFRLARTAEAEKAMSPAGAHNPAAGAAPAAGAVSAKPTP
jgi:type IV pilus assembly protein PilN